MNRRPQRLLHRKNRPSRLRFARLLAAERLEDRSLLAAVDYQIHLVAPGGSAAGPDLSSVSVGDAYDLVVTTQDTRDNPGAFAGVFAGYLDIGYDSSKTHVQVAEVQNLTITGSGSFSLTFGADTTTPITKVANTTTLAASIQSALAALPGIGAGNIEVRYVDIPSGTGRYEVWFTGKFYGQDVPNMTVAPGATATVSIAYDGDLQTAAGTQYAFREGFRSRTAGNLYQNGVGGIDAVNLMDEVGAFYSGGFSPPPGQGVFELVRARMVASAAGTVKFTPDVTNMIVPADYTLVLGSNNPVAPADITTAPKSLTINPAIPIVAVNDSATVAEDSGGTTIDVLANDTTSPATGQTKNVVGVTQPLHGSVSFTATGVTYTPAPDYNGPDAFTYTAQNITAGAGSASAMATVSLTVTSVNDKPTLDLISDRTINEDAGLQTVALLGISAGGGESQTLSVKATSDNPALTGDVSVDYTNPNSTGSLSFTPAANQSGTATITVTVKDNGGTENGGIDTLTRTFTVNVNAVNDTPTLDSIDNRTINEDATLQTVALAGISAGGGESQTLSVKATSDNPGLTGDISVDYSSPSSTGSLSFTPKANQSGTATITVTVKDDGGTEHGGIDTVTRTFVVTVNAINDAPTLDTIGNVTINEDATQFVTLSGISAGPGESQTLTVKATSDNSALFGDIAVTYTSPNSSGTLVLTPKSNQSGTATITVTVQDDGGGGGGGVDTVIRTFTITVLAVNDAPSFAKGDDQETNDEAGDVVVANWAKSISAGPADEASQTLSFTVTADHESLFKTTPSIDATGTLIYTPAPNMEGTTVVTVVLHDSGGTEHGGSDTSGIQTFSIHVAKLHPNHNAAKPLDASGDNAITAADPLACINYINAFGPGSVDKAPADTGYLDVNHDGSISAADPLDVINYINAFGPDNGNGESAAATDLLLSDPTSIATNPPATNNDLASTIAMLALDATNQYGRRRT